MHTLTDPESVELGFSLVAESMHLSFVTALPASINTDQASWLVGSSDGPQFITGIPKTHACF